MKPVRNRFQCMECQRTKMLFESKSKAINFIKFNTDEIKSDNGGLIIINRKNIEFDVFCQIVAVSLHYKLKRGNYESYRIIVNVFIVCSSADIPGFGYHCCYCILNRKYSRQHIIVLGNYARYYCVLFICEIVDCM